MNFSKFLYNSVPYITSFFLGILLISCHNSEKSPEDITPNQIVPTQPQMDYQKMEVIGFVHFTTNTFTGKEWGYGDEKPTIFNPTQLDAEQWVLTAKEAGIKELILTAKHHDGFCLWPSKFTEHSIKNSPYKDGKGDIVKEFVEACKKHGMKAGLYLSPWDRNHASYGKSEYIDYYKKQLEELLSDYGEINEIWFDGANGGDGYYGGANEMRKIDSQSYYPWKEIFSLAKTLQPQIKIFSDMGPDVHWIGNEQGFAGDPFWSTISTDKLVVGHSDTSYLNTGDPEGNQWIVGQCDVSIRPGWFYHQEEDPSVKSPEELMEIYYKSVGRNAILLLNIPPDQRGLFHENDIQTLKSWKHLLDTTFETNLAQNASISASNHRLHHEKFEPNNLIDSNKTNYWATDDSIQSAELTIKLPQKTRFDIIQLQEPIQFGQRIEEFDIQIEKDGTWQTIFKGTTIGYKRIAKVEPTEASKIRLSILKSNNTIALSNIEVYQSATK